jgi:uncharacterized protein YodC (DUF2158 family)
MSFKIGDTVQLKSGGPKMTIESIQDDGSYWCVWFVDKGDQRKGAPFKGEMLLAV